MTPRRTGISLVLCFLLMLLAPVAVHAGNIGPIPNPIDPLPTCSSTEILIPFPLSPFCFNPFDILSAFLRWIAALVAHGAAGVLGPALAIATWAPNLADRGPLFGPLDDVYDTMLSLAWALYGGLGFLALCDAARRGMMSSAPGALYSVVGPLVGVAAALTALFWGLDIVLGMLSALTNAIDVRGLSDLQKTLIDSVTGQTQTPAAPLLALVNAAAAVVFVVLCVLIALDRTMGLAFLAFLIPMAPLCVVCFLAPSRTVARLTDWWLTNTMIYGLYPLFYTVALKVEVALLFGLAHDPQFASTVLQRVLGIAGLLFIRRLPRHIHSIAGGMAPTHLSLTAMSERITGGMTARAGRFFSPTDV